MSFRFPRWLWSTATLVCLSAPAAADLVIDGSNDFDAASTYATSDSNYTGYAAFGPSSLHFAIDGPDIAGGGPAHWYVTYIGSGAINSTKTGLNFNTQQPGLPFPADLAFQWSPGSGGILKELDGGSWVNSASSLSFNQSGSFVEVAVPKPLIGGANSVDLVSYLLFEGSGFESSYAVFPTDSFANGTYDPDPSAFLTIASVPEVSPAMIGSLLTAFGLVSRGRRSATSVD